MLLLRRESLQEGAAWMYEIKLDGYRAVAIKTTGKVGLRSRDYKDFSARYPTIVNALSRLPNETVVDGEVVAFDEEGRPSFNFLQNYGSARSDICFYIFDLMVLAGRDVMGGSSTSQRGRMTDYSSPIGLGECCRLAMCIW